MSKSDKHKFDYYRMKVVQSEFLLEFTSLKDLLRYADNYHQRSIFLLPAENGTPERFAFSYKGGLLQHPTLGFETLEDFSTALQNGFEEAASFYAARQLGFAKYSEYKMSVEAGITDAKAYEEIKKEGYIEAFALLEKERSENPDLPRLEQITNANQLYQFVKEQGFNGHKEFNEALLRGFTQALEFRTANSAEFKTYHDFKAAEEQGFKTSFDYYFAIEKGITTKDEYYQYLDLESLHLPDVKHDLKVLLIYLSKLTDGKRTSLTKLYDLWQKEINAYRKPGGELPAWFSTSVATIEELATVLHTHQAIKKYGVYDTDGEFFETKKLKDRMIIIDGSNVAHGNPGKQAAKPTAKYVLKMVQFLKSKGFTDITVYSDASLKHRLEDGDALKQVKELCQYRETPAETPADLFLIAFVKRHHCMIVSNDTFREWKIADSWVAENMDYYRMSFMFDGDEVYMPDVEEKQ